MRRDMESIRELPLKLEAIPSLIYNCARLLIGLCFVAVSLLVGAAAANAAISTIDSPTCVQGKPPEEAIPECTKALSLPDLDATSRRSALITRANAYMSENKAALAIFDLEASEQIAHAPQVALVLGNLYVNVGRSDDAIAEFTKLINSGAGTGIVYNFRGAAFENAGKYDDAIQDFNRALFLMPDYVVALNNRSAAYAKAGNNAAALKDLDEVILKDPNLALAWVNKCTLQERTGDRAAAFKSCDKAKELAPDNPMVLTGVGIAHYEVGDFDQAVAYYENSLKLQPNDPIALYCRSLAERKLGHDAEADVGLQRAEQLMPNVVETEARYGVH
jgi:tetratricopeptide (TPR) repeat protein